MTKGASTRSLPGQPNPLVVLPSVLAIHDLRRRINRHFTKKPLREEDLVTLLMLDPPSVLRGLRAARQPLYGNRQERWSIPLLVRTIGSAMSLRLCLAKERGTAGTTEIRHVWMRSIATACSAEILAEGTSIEPATAYLFGLLRPLPALFEALGELQHSRSASPQAVATLLHSWNLPDELLAASGLAPADQLPAELVDLLADAERAADLAGFPLRGESQDPTASAIDNASSTLLGTAHRTRRAVEALLRKVGLDFTQPEAGTEPTRAAIDSRALAAPKVSSFEEIVLTMLSCSGGTTYRGVITALTAASVRHGGYDRATYARLSPNGTLVVRSKSDLTSRRVAIARITPNEAEVAELRKALQEGRALRIEADPSAPSGFLATLGLDEALVVPVNRELATPSLLILDRSISIEPIRPVVDTDRAMAFGLSGSLLVENQLLQKRRQRAQKFASTDGLTRLLNRSAGIQTLEQELLRSSRNSQPVSVLLCDLDNFKQLNDTHGHLQGDHALRQTAEVLRQTARRTDHVSRYGGEEFLVVLPETSAEEATVLAARLHIAIAERGFLIGLPLTASIGLAVVRPGDTWETVLQRADQALYASKERGRNRFSADGSDEPAPVVPEVSGFRPFPDSHL